MGMDNIQLKQEDILDGQPVLSDINPVTNTRSVDNPNTGEKLDETIARMWSVINNKLTRIVNSVNGRTGVVVLTAEDVGLGDVDNVSYAEIKQWVRETMEAEFANRAMKLYGSLAEVQAIAATNDKSYAWAPFFCDTISSTDKHSAIGFYKWDPINNILAYEYKAVNVIGGTDLSIEYDANGIIKVKIHPDEHALYVEDDAGGSGLRIDESKLRGNVYHMNGLYGDGTQTQQLPDSTSLLALYSEWKTDQNTKVSIYINDIPSNTGGNDNYFNSEWEGRLVKGDMIITNFAFKDISGTGITADTGLMGQQPAIGVVTAAPDDPEGNDSYEIKFYTIRTFIGNQYGFGLKYFDTHSDDAGNGTSTGQLGIFPLHALRTFGDGIKENLSGLNIYYSGRPNVGSPSSAASRPGSPSFFTPWGPESIDSLNINGIRVATDTTLATYASETLRPSRDMYYDYETRSLCYFGSARARNWVPPQWVTTLHTEIATTPEERIANQIPENGYSSNLSAITINLNKMVRVVDKEVAHNAWTYLFSDISGIKFIEPPDIVGGSITDKYMNLSEIGMNDGKDAVGNELTRDERLYNWTSGGIAVNIGKFLEIRPTNTEKAVEYSNGGKVQVRIGPGLTEQVEYVITTEEPQNFERPDVYSKYYYLAADNVTFRPLEYQYFYDPAEPELWENKYFDYYVLRYVNVSGETAPAWEADTYYEKGAGEYEYILTTEQPLDWSTSYRNYYTATDEFEPVARVYDGNIPEWIPETFYYRSPLTWDLAEFRHTDIYERREYNRITIKPDPETLGFNENGELTVIGGVGGKNIRYVDYRGCFFDTVPGQEVGDVVVLGSGLKITGGSIPLDMNLGLATKKAYVADTLDNSGMGELLEYYIDHPVGGTAPTTATFQNIDATRTSLAADISGANDKNVIDSIGDALYDEATFVGDLVASDEVRLYLTEHEDDIKDRIEALFTSIDGYTTEKATWFGNIMTFFGIATPEPGTDLKTYLISQIPTMKVYDTSKGSYLYMLDWLFALKFQDA